METFINWLRGLSPRTKLMLAVALFIFVLDEVVINFVFGAWDFSRFVTSNINWGASLLVLLIIGGRKAYVYIVNKANEEADYDDEDYSIEDMYG
jgi:hypothetical protein